MIEIKNLSFSYIKRQPDGTDTESIALSGINLNIREGEFVAVLGHNGSGKSTLAKHFNGILLPTSGDCIIDGMNTREEENLLHSKTKRQLTEMEENILKIRSSVGMVFQNPDNQMVAAVVEDDVAFAPENLGVPSKEIRQRVDSALKTVGMYDYRRSQPAHLSGGQKQRVAIASVLAMEPKYVILDEPTAMLDPQGRQEVISTVKKLNREQGVTVVLITHYMEEAAEADRVIVIDNGKVVLDNTPFEVFKEVDRLKEIGLDVPQATELAYELRKMGFDIPHVIDVESCTREILKLQEADK